MSDTLEKKWLNSTACRLCELPLSSTASILEEFVCTLTDEQLALDYRQADLARNALRLQAAQRGSTARLEQLIAEKDFVFWLTGEILMRRRVDMDAVKDGDI